MKRHGYSHTTSQAGYVFSLDEAGPEAVEYALQEGAADATSGDDAWLPATQYLASKSKARIGAANPTETRIAARKRYKEILAGIVAPPPHVEREYRMRNKRWRYNVMLNDAAYEEALRLEEHPDPNVALLVAVFIADRAWALGAGRKSPRFCMNPQCLRPIEESSGRGRPRMFCENGGRCKNAAASRAKRNRENPNRYERLEIFRLVELSLASVPWLCRPASLSTEALPHAWLRFRRHA